MDLTVSDVSDERHTMDIAELRKTKSGREYLKKHGYHIEEFKRDFAKREFIGWDGEGVTVNGKHHYILFGASSKHTVQGESLGTRECFDLMLQCSLDLPKRIHVGFSFDYDVEMITKDIPANVMKRLYDEGTVWWGKYRIEYIPRKWFYISAKHRNRKTSIKIWDIFTFFGSSFVKALEDYLGNTPNIQQIKEGKSERNQFDYNDLETFIKPYWEVELIELVNLATKLRELLLDAGIEIKHWHGPGAVATNIFGQHNTDEYRAESPEKVKDAAQYAFAGGRFELFQIGRANKKVYVYDINSAYPAGFSQLPSLNASWEYVENPKEISRFGVYHIEYDSINSPNNPATKPQPLFFRDSQSCVHFPQRVSGWYWTPEAKGLMANPYAEIKSGWVLNDDGSYPLEWVAEWYYKRKEWQRQGIQAERALKVGINSLYGKTAQRVGWKIDRLPRWHQLEWAGFVTSYTRTILWEAITQAMAKGSLIACETDSVFSSEPLDLPLSENLGEWDCNVYDDLIYLQNGVYWFLKDGKWKPKFRGLDPDSLTVDNAMDMLASVDMRRENPEIVGTTTRFVGGKLALKTDQRRWRTWETEPRKVQMGGEGKRVHNPYFCTYCETDEYIPPSEVMHELAITKPWGGNSHPHYIPWREKDETASWEDQIQPDYTR